VTASFKPGDKREIGMKKVRLVAFNTAIARLYKSVIFRIVKEFLRFKTRRIHIFIYYNGNGGVKTVHSKTGGPFPFSWYDESTDIWIGGTD